MKAKDSKNSIRRNWLPGLFICLFLTLGMGQCERAQEDPQQEVDFDSQVQGEGATEPGGASAGFGTDRDETATEEKIRDIIRQHLPPPACGNGLLEPGEQCEDGNTTSGDGCDAACQKETAGPPDCGNHIWEGGEQCDDGNTTPGDGCDAACQLEIGGTGGGGGSGGGGLGINTPPPLTSEGCAAATGSANPNCAWALLGIWGLINTPFVNFTGIGLYSYDDDGNPYQQITANTMGEPVQIIFNTFDQDNRPLYQQDIRRANLSVPGPLNVMSLTFQNYLTTGVYAGEPQDKIIVTMDGNTQTIVPGSLNLPGIVVHEFQYDYTNSNFVPYIENTNIDTVALTNPGMSHPLAQNTIFEGHQKDADGKLIRVLKTFKDSSFNDVRHEDLYFVRHSSGPLDGKIDMLVLNYTNCAEDPTGLHCKSDPLLPYRVIHGVIQAKYAYDAEGRLSGITFEEKKNPGPGQAVDLGVDQTTECSIEYWDNPYNLPIHRLPRFFKDLGFSETGLIKSMICIDPASMQQTFGRQGFFLTFIWQPLWRFIPTAEIPQ